MDFETLMSMNYDELLHNQDCRVLLTNYLDTVDSVENRDVFYVKALTKVGTHLVVEDPNYFTNSQLEKLTQFNYQGSEIAKKEFESKKDSLDEDQIRYKVMEGHFLGHAGTINKVLFERTKDPKFAFQSYDCIVDAAQICLEYDENYSTKACSYLTSLSWIAYQETKELSWLDKVIEVSTTYVEISDKMTTSHAYALSLRAKAEFEAHKILGENGFLDDSISSCREGLEILNKLSEDKIDLTFNLNMTLASSLMELSKIHQKNEDIVVAQHQAYIEAYETVKTENRDRAAEPIMFASKASSILYQITRKRDFLVRSYDEIMQAKELVKLDDILKNAMIYRTAGDISHNLFFETKKSTHAKRSKKFYEYYFQICEEHPELISDHYKKAGHRHRIICGFLRKRRGK